MSFGGTNKRHFALEEWADFARGLVPQGQREAMQTHLDAGCTTCEQVLGTWRRVHEAARREASYQPPDGAVRSAKAMFAQLKPSTSRRGAAAIAELLFDSFLSPLPAGVRSAAGTSRQLLYGSGDYRVDVRIEPQQDSDKVSVVGQILDSLEPDAGVASAPITLLRGRKVLVESSTNRFGEFHFECAVDTALLIRVQAPNGTQFQVPLVEPRYLLGEMRINRGSPVRSSSPSKRTKSTGKKV
jgi:hypothetical protein